ncbi:hypothetical protein LEP1GSC048_1722 [Leptospira santarosai serovar Shermani str. 1342KT]|nr:hypothetical protein LEP1GSC048_1722 [Leptospira santarosai serovar Shermani str. 1342KT]
MRWLVIPAQRSYRLDRTALKERNITLRNQRPDRIDSKVDFGERKITIKILKPILHTTPPR